MECNTPIDYFRQIYICISKDITIRLDTIPKYLNHSPASLAIGHIKLLKCTHPQHMKVSISTLTYTDR